MTYFKLVNLLILFFGKFEKQISFDFYNPNEELNVDLVQVAGDGVRCRHSSVVVAVVGIQWATLVWLKSARGGFNGVSPSASFCPLCPVLTASWSLFLSVL